MAFAVNGCNNKVAFIQQILTFGLKRKSVLQNIVSNVYQFILIVKSIDGVGFL